MKLIIGFAILGFLIGDMAGLTSESVVSKIIALLFALFGGSVIVLFQRFSFDDRDQIGGLIGAIALGALLGTQTGIVTSQYRLLSPKAMRDKDPKDSPYLRSSITEAKTHIDERYEAHIIDAAEAYKELSQALQESVK